MKSIRRVGPLALTGAILLGILACHPARAQEFRVHWMEAYDNVSAFSCGYAKVERDGEAFFLDQEGNRLEIQTDYVDEVLGDFHNGLAVFVERLWEPGAPTPGAGWIGLDGTVVFPPEYCFTTLSSSSFHQNFLFAQTLEGESRVLSCNGEVVATAPVYIELDQVTETLNGLVPVWITDETGERKIGFADRAFNIVLPGAYYGTIYGFLEGGAYVDLIPWTESCIINTKGELIWGPVDYTDPNWVFYADGFWNGLVSVPDQSGKWGAIDTHGNVVIPYEYDFYFEFHQGYAFACKDSVLQVIDTSGNLVIPCVDSENFGEDTYRYHFSEGLAAVCREGKWGYIDLTGRQVIPCVYADAQPFSEGLAWVQREDGMWGILKSPLAARSDWADEEIRDAYIHELVTERTAFAFQSTLTRMQCAELMTNLAELVTGRPIFEAEYDRFTDTMDWIPRKAAAVGLTEGAGDGSYFEPDGSVTREQLAAMLFRTISYLEAETGQTVLPESGSLAGYNDAGQVSDWAVDAVAALNANGILQGTSGTSLSPKDTTTVEQGILLALRTYQSLMS